MSPEQYRRQYLEPVAARPAPSANEVTLAVQHWFAPREPPRQVGLHDLFTAGVRCGHGESLAHLAARAREHDAQEGGLSVAPP